MKPITVIPARLKSTRLPNKPLAEIAGKPMIVHVLERAKEAALGPVLVACCEQEVYDVVTAAGGEAIMTEPDLPSGSDRIHEAVSKFDPQSHHDVVINLQGDLPAIDPHLIQDVALPLENPAVDIGTLVCEIVDDHEVNDPNVVKCIAAFKDQHRIARALYFTRATAPTGAGPLYHHIGLYAYRRSALNRFVSLNEGILEAREKLEQLRALENDMRIDAVRVDSVPVGVDTADDLERIRAHFARG